MPVTTFLNPAECREDTSNTTVNQWLREVRQASGVDWRVRERAITYRRGLFLRKATYRRYALLKQIAGIEYQIINFYVEKSESSINEEVDASVLVAYLMGLYNGQYLKENPTIADFKKGCPIQA